MKRFCLVLLPLLLTLMSGCRTICRISSNANGAKVYLDNAFKGVTPCDVELDDGKSSYTLKLEHPDYQPYSYMISQKQVGTSTQSYQQTNTNVNANTNAYVSPYGNRATTNTYGTVNQNTNTNTYSTPIYAWATGYHIDMTPLSHGSQPSASSTSTQNATGSRGAFCSNCGTSNAASTKFCGGCGARR